MSSNKRSVIQALIFDFDGLILDTELPEYESWKELYQAYGCELSFSVWAECIGAGYGEVLEPYDYLEELLGRPVDRGTIDAQRLPRHDELLQAQPILPGVEDYIAGGKRLGLKLGIASSSDRKWVENHLTRLGLIEHFDEIRTADDVNKAKPDPELFLAALEALGVQAEEAIVLEDSPNGVLAANRAGIFSVAVPNPLTRQLDLSLADLQLNSLADLPLEKLIEKVQKSRKNERI